MHQLISCNCACSPFHSTIPFHHSIPPFHSTIPFHIPVQQLETPSYCRGCILTQSCTCFCVWQWICLFIDLEYEIHRCSCLNTKQALRMVEERVFVNAKKERLVTRLNQSSVELENSIEHMPRAPRSYACASLIPRLHPLTRRNGLVNQVKFLGLEHNLATTYLAMFRTFYAKPAQKGSYQ